MMQYKGNNFRKILEAILSQKHKQPITIGAYMHLPDNQVDVEYSYRERGQTKGHSTKITATMILEFQMNYSL